VEKKVPVGTPVHYFPEGIKFNKNPIAATVIEYSGNGICTLDVHTSAIRSSIKVNVWHVDAPELKDQEHLRMLYGAWDYHPWFTPPQDAAEPTKSAEPKIVQEQSTPERMKKPAKPDLVGTDA
jgi:hypothetical protein